MDLETGLIGRTADLNYIAQCAEEGKCCSLVGVSNLGKSALLRNLCSPTRRTEGHGTFVYVDCNQMPERTERAFFIAAWQALAAVLEAKAGAKVHARVERLFDEMVHASTSTEAVVHFDEGLAWAIEFLSHPLVLCLDEFDESYQGLEPQALLKLRAMKDRYSEKIAYVTATQRELASLTITREQGEFYELIPPRVRFLHFWTPEETKAFCEYVARRDHVTFDELDLHFIHDQADGHPGLVQAVCYALGAVTGAPLRDRHQDLVIHQVVAEGLDRNPDVQSECQKIWNDLEQDERDALVLGNHAEADDPANTAWIRLKMKSVVRESPEGPVLFARVFDNFVRRQRAVQKPAERGIYVDVDAGQVRVDGKAIESLTELEYRLLLFFYGRINRVCDKYSIVEAVWGQDYVDQVDDARIEKLVSRLRQKIEPDPTHPKYLHSLRGRGYKLVR